MPNLDEAQASAHTANQGAGTTIVDSPLPATTTPPVPEKVAAKPADNAATPDKPADAATPVQPDELAQLATQLDVDREHLAQFKDADTARSQISKWLEDQVRQGREYLAATAAEGRQRDQQGRFVPAAPATPPPAVPTAQAPQQSSISADLGLSEDDPAAKAIRALEAKLADTSGTVSQLVESIQQEREAAQNERAVALDREAIAVVDSWKSPAFGVSESRTELQQAAIDRIFEVANDITAAAFARRRDMRDVPSLKARLERARFLLDKNPTPPASQATPAAPVALPESANQHTTPGKLGGMASVWSQDPEILASLGK